MPEADEAAQAALTLVRAAWAAAGWNPFSGVCYTARSGCHLGQSLEWLFLSIKIFLAAKSCVSDEVYTVSYAVGWGCGCWCGDVAMSVMVSGDSAAPGANTSHPSLCTLFPGPRGSWSSCCTFLGPEAARWAEQQGRGVWVRTQRALHRLTRLYRLCFWSPEWSAPVAGNARRLDGAASSQSSRH